MLAKHVKESEQHVGRLSCELQRKAGAHVQTELQ